MARILIGCEFSATVRQAFENLNLGHDVWSCDLLDTEIPGKHYKGNVLDIINDGWDLAIFHPSCQFLSNAGVRHLWSVASKNGVICKIHGQVRWQAMREGAEFFNILKNANIPRICIENPVPHRYAREIIGNYTQLIQPWQFNTTQSKGICLWLKNLPKLEGTINVKEEMMKLPKSKRNKVHYASPGPNRWKERSRFFPEIARAMAEQWGSLQ